MLLLCCWCFCALTINAYSFLLGSSGSTNGDNQYISLETLLAEKKELVGRIDQLRHSQEQTIRLLTQQLDKKFQNLELYTKTENCSCETLSDLRSKEIVDFKDNYTQLIYRYNNFEIHQAKTEGELLRKIVYLENKFRDFQIGFNRNLTTLRSDINIQFASGSKTSRGKMIFFPTQSV